MSEVADSIKNTWIKKAISLGYSAASILMSSLYPREFEMYMIAFELCDSKGKTLDYFSFPIMPSEMQISEKNATKSQSTFGGVSSVSSSVYIPKMVKISGNFGRNFKILYRNKVTVPFIKKVEVERSYGIGSPKKELELTNSIKTGYGCIKVLESIINRSVGIDEYGNCNRLYFYNLAFGESFLVKVGNFDFQQTLSTNAIWNYSLDIECVCPIYLDKIGENKARKAILNASIQLGMNTLVNGVKDTLRAKA